MLDIGVGPNPYFPRDEPCLRLWGGEAIAGAYKTVGLGED